MIREFIINSYRGLNRLELKYLNKINVFAGPNNCGKTSILEAVILSGLFDDVDLLVDTLVSRYHGFLQSILIPCFLLGQNRLFVLSQDWMTQKSYCIRIYYMKKTRLLTKMKKPVSPWFLNCVFYMVMMV